MIKNPKIAGVLKRMADFEKRWTAKFAVDDDTGMFLYNLVLDKKPGNILELGTWRGASAMYMASALKELRAGKVVTVDSDREKLEEAKNNFSEAGLSDFISVNEGDIDDYLAGDNEKYDLIFMDAAKKPQGRWLKLALKNNAQAGTIIVVDDVITMGDKMEDLFEYVSQNSSLLSRVEKIDDGLLIIEVL